MPQKMWEAVPESGPHAHQWRIRAQHQDLRKYLNQKQLQESAQKDVQVGLGQMSGKQIWKEKTHKDKNTILITSLPFKSDVSKTKNQIFLFSFPLCFIARLQRFVF